MKLTFYGGVGEVGRACALLEEGNRNLMFDCGIKLGEKTEYPLIDDDTLKNVENVYISHAHLDHSGYIPHVYNKGIKPKVYVTKPTRDMMGVLLADYRRLQTEGLFKQKDVDEVMKKAIITEFNTPVHDGFDFTLHNSGHILGSSMIRANGVLYTGDICTRKTRILSPCERDISAHTAILESTYGGKNDTLPSLKDSSTRLVKIINETIDKGGWVLIPSFAVGRAQEILLTLDDYMKSGALRETKIYIDGMINKVMSIYRHNSMYANDDIKNRILMSEDNPYKSKFFHIPKSKNRKDVLKEPCIIVSTSGMLSGGPALFYLENLAGDSKNSLVFVGYQAPGTLGEKILEGERKIQIKEKELDLKMRVERVKISGHADFNELLQFANGIKGLKKIFLFHGEKSDLKESLEKKYEVIMPKLHEEYTI